MKKVYVTCMISGDDLNELRKLYDVEMNETDVKLDHDVLIEKCKDVDAILSMFYDNIDEDFIKRCRNLEVIANYAVGYNNIDYKFAESQGIYVSNTPDVVTDSTADLAFGLLLAVSRRVIEGHEVILNKGIKTWTPTWFLGKDLRGKTMGIIGLGRIGQNFARKAKAFNMNIIHCSNSPKPEIEKELDAKYVSKDELIKKSDFISLHVPLTNDTKYIIGKEEFKLMKNDAIIINTSRGGVVDEVALVEALKNKEIYGAGLDVFENEPNVYEELLGLDNLVLTPHIGSATEDTRYGMTKLAVEAIIEGLSGKLPTNNVY